MVEYKPDKPSKCTWSLNNKNGESYHHHINLKSPQPCVCGDKVYDNILEYIGNTPLVRLNNIAKKYGIECDLLGKCEFLNPGGSVKDRIGYRMVAEAKRDGSLKPGATIIEPSSGNTGIGIAVAAAIYGYKCIIIIAEKMSKEKVSVLKGLGARVIRTRTSAAYYEKDSLFQVAAALNEQIENSIILDQYANPYNPIAHYDMTAEEILRDTDNAVDVIVISAGTGGTLAGITRKIKEKLPSCKIVAVDPYGSSLAPKFTDQDKNTKFYEVEGIGYDFVPTVIDRDHVDQWIKTRDTESLTIARELISLEGLLCGGSSGSAVYGAIQVAKTLKKGQKCVVILPDSLRNYLSKFLDNSWMIERGLLDCLPINDNSKQWWDNSIATVRLKRSKQLSPKMSLPDAISWLTKATNDIFPVIGDETMKVIGIVSLQRIFDIYINSENPEEKAIQHIMETNMNPIYQTESTLGRVYHSLNNSSEVVVVHSPEDYSYVGNITKIDFLLYIDYLRKMNKDAEDL